MLAEGSIGDFLLRSDPDLAVIDDTVQATWSWASNLQRQFAPKRAGPPRGSKVPYRKIDASGHSTPALETD